MAPLLRHPGALLATLAVLLVHLCASPAAAYDLTTTDITEMQAAIKTEFQLTDSYGTQCAPCAVGDNVGALVRLVFHDAAGGGGPNGEGGMNGCIDFSTTDNNGLATIVEQLDSIYTPFASKISKADFWLLSANLAIQYASTQAATTHLPSVLPASAGTLVLPFRYGRVDDDNCTGLDAGRLPGAGFNWTEMKSLFETRIGMTLQQTVAIMGAHSVGRAQYNNSGFEGGWSPFQSTFSHYYYQFLGGVKWLNSNASNVWIDTVPSPNPIMLTVDVEPMLTPSSKCALFFNSSGFGTTGCSINTESNSLIVSYSQCGSCFQGNFSAAWKVLSEFQYTSLTEVGSTTTTAPTTASPTTASPTTASPTTASPTTASPTTAAPTTTPSGSPPSGAPPSGAPPSGTPPAVNSTVVPSGTPPNVNSTVVPSGTPPNVNSTVVPSGTPPNVNSTVHPSGTPPNVNSTVHPSGTPPNVNSTVHPSGTPPNVNSTVQPTPPTPSTAAPTTATPTTTSEASTTSGTLSSQNTIIVAVVVSVGGVLLILVLIQGLFIMRRRRSLQAKAKAAYAEQQVADAKAAQSSTTAPANSDAAAETGVPASA